MTTSVNIIADTMGQLFTPSLVSSTSPRRSELVVVQQSAVHQLAEISKEYIFRLNNITPLIISILCGKVHFGKSVPCT